MASDAIPIGDLPMTVSESGARTYKPDSSGVHYYWSLGLFAVGTTGLIGFHDSWVQIGASLMPVLWGVWMAICTRAVLTSWFVITPDQIISVQTRYQIGLRWQDVREINIRQRAQGRVPGRADRQVVVVGPDGVKWPFNSSVLSVEDEKDFLRQIRMRARCPIKTLTLGMS